MNGARAQRGDHSGPSLRAYTGYNPDEAGLMPSDGTRVGKGLILG